jgi:hypothetical protein
MCLQVHATEMQVRRELFRKGDQFVAFLGAGDARSRGAAARAHFRPLEDRRKTALIAATQAQSLSLERIDAWTWKGRKTCTLEFVQYEWRSTK